MADTQPNPTPNQNLVPAANPVQPAAPTIAEDRIHLMVRNRKQILIDEDVKAVTSTNDTGLFDVLPEHTNFISVINKSITAHKMDGTTQEIPLANGIMKIKDSSVRCFIDLLSAEAPIADQPQLKNAA